MAYTQACVICSEPYLDPRSLPCGHSFCLSCMDNWQNSSGWWEEDSFPSKVHRRDHDSNWVGASGSRSRNWAFNCPECRRVHVLPRNGVQSYPRNYALTRVTDRQRDFNLNQCLGCNKDRKVKARCENCNMDICSQCIHDHGQYRFTSGHKIVPLGHAVGMDSHNSSKSYKMKPIRSPSKHQDHDERELSLPRCNEGDSVGKCQYHSGKLLEFFCEDCSEPICRLGDLERHRRHHTITSGEYRNMVVKDLAALKEKMNQMEKNVEEYKNIQKKEMSAAHTLEQRILAKKQVLIKTIESKAEALLDRVKIVSADFCESVETEQHYLGTKIDRARSCRKATFHFLENMKKENSHVVFARHREVKKMMDVVDSSVKIRKFTKSSIHELEFVESRADVEKEMGSLFGSLSSKVSDSSKTKSNVKEDPFPMLVPINTIDAKAASDKHECRLVDITFLTDGDMAVTDSKEGNKKIKVFSLDGHLKQESTTREFRDPTHLCPVPGIQKEVLVLDCSVSHKIIKWNSVTGKSRPFLASPRDGSEATGVSATRSKIGSYAAIVTHESSAILLANINGTLDKKLKIKALGSASYLVGSTCHDKMFVNHGHFITAYCGNGDFYWQADYEIFQKLKGMASSKEGALFVADMRAGCVFLLSPSGELKATVLQGLNKPTGVAYEEELGLLAVTEWDTNVIHIYNLDISLFLK